MSEFGLQSEYKLPTIKYSDFQKKDHNDSFKFEFILQQQYIYKNKTKKNRILNKPNKIFTVYDSLQDEYVKKNLEVTIGTLEQFIDTKSADPTPLLPNLRLKIRKNKKNEQQEDINEFFQQKRNNQLQEKNPIETLKNSEDEKSRAQAAKQIVTQIFKKIYGEDVDKFEEKNSKQSLEKFFFEKPDKINDQKIVFIKKNSKLSQKERFDLFEKSQFLRNMENKSNKYKNLTNGRQIVIRQGSQFNIDESDQYEALKNSEIVQKISNQNKKQTPDSNKIKTRNYNTNIFNFVEQNGMKQNPTNSRAKQKRIEALLRLKAQYSNVDQIWKQFWKDANLSSNTQNAQEYMEAHLKLHEDVRNFFESQKLSIDRQHQIQCQLIERKNEQTKLEQQQICIIDTNQLEKLVIRNHEISDIELMYILMDTDEWNQLHQIEFYNTKLSDGAMKLLFCTIQLECRNIEFLSFYDNKNPQTNQLENILKQQQSLEIIKFVKMNINSFQFVQICLQICQQNIKVIDFSDNKIGLQNLFDDDKKKQKKIKKAKNHQRPCQDIQSLLNQLI